MFSQQNLHLCTTAVGVSISGIHCMCNIAIGLLFWCVAFTSNLLWLLWLVKKTHPQNKTHSNTIERVWSCHTLLKSSPYQISRCPCNMHSEVHCGKLNPVPYLSASDSETSSCSWSSYCCSGSLLSRASLSKPSPVALKLFHFSWNDRGKESKREWCWRTNGGKNNIVEWKLREINERVHKLWTLKIIRCTSIYLPIQTHIAVIFGVCIY